MSARLSDAEMRLLSLLAVLAFLPVAAKKERDELASLDEDAGKPVILTETILSLAHRGLIRLDLDIALSNYDYACFADYPVHGSMALTARGQDVLELMEIRGLE